MNLMLRNINKKNGEHTHQKKEWIGDVYVATELKIGIGANLMLKNDFKSLRTSTVQDIKILENRLYLETRNTIYIFEIL